MGLWKGRKKNSLIGNIKESLNYFNLWKLVIQCQKKKRANFTLNVITVKYTLLYNNGYNYSSWEQFQ